MKGGDALQNIGDQLDTSQNQEDKGKITHRHAGKMFRRDCVCFGIVAWHGLKNRVIQTIFLFMASELSRNNPSFPPAEPVIYLFTRFPHWSETFLQREVRAMAKLGVALELHTLWGGEDHFEGLPVRRFAKWKLAKLLYLLPRTALTNPGFIGRWLEKLVGTRPISLLNLGENLLGLAFAILHAPEFRRRRLHHFHAVWATMPAAAALGLHELTGHPYSMGAHAYDVFEHGGDPFLREKMASALFVHTSVGATRERLYQFTSEPDKIVLVRRGLNSLPPRTFAGFSPGEPRRIISIGRLVPKKGFYYQLAVYAALRAAGFDFRAEIIGDGPLRESLKERIRTMGLTGCVTLAGALSQDEVQERLQRADVFLFTGIIDADGNRDGVPNVLPEAMAHGVLVLASPMDGVCEVIEDGVTGFLCPVDQPEQWVHRLRELENNPNLRQSVREQARDWVEGHFVAEANARRLLETAVERRKQ